jgi:hypothetical protein
LVNLGGFDLGAFGICNAVDAPVFMVAERIACAVLHVADEDVVPVDKVERAIGRELEVNGTKVATIAFSMDMKALFGSSGSGTQVVRVSDGQLYSMSMVMSMTIPNQKTQKSTKAEMNISVAMVK